MRPWLLLLSLLVSDLSPLGDGDLVMENSSWSLYRKVLLNGQMTPRGLKILQTQAEHPCMCIQRHCVYVAVQHKQRTSPFYWAYTLHYDRGCSLSRREFKGIIHGIHIPALVVALLHGEGNSVPAFLVKPNTLPVLHVIQTLHFINEIPPTKATGEPGHIATDVIRHQPDSGSAWSLHHRTASGHNFQAFLLEKSKNWAPTTIVQLQKMLTKRCCAARSVIISCCLKKGEIRPALKSKKKSEQQTVQQQIRQKESTRRAMDIKVHTEYEGQRPSKALVQAAALHSGSSSMKTSDPSRLGIRREAVRIIKKNEHLNSDEESLLRKSVQRQRSLKATSRANDDGFYVKRRLLLVSRERTESINRRRYEMRAAQDHNREDFGGKIIIKQAEFRSPEGGSETKQSNTIENGDQERLAYIRRAHFTHKADNNDVDRKQMLTEAGEEVLIMLFLPDTERETQTEPLLERKLILNTDTGWKTVNIHIKELDDPPTLTEVMEENFIIEPDNSKCKCLKGSPISLETSAQDRRKGTHIKPAESAATVTTASPHTEEQVTETAGTTEDTQANNTSHESMSINHTKQEPSEESVIPSPPSVKMMETETAKTEHIVETTTVNMEIKETTSTTEVFNQASTQTTDGLPSAHKTTTTTTIPETEADTEPRYIRCMTTTNNNVRAATEKPFSGLRMREDVLADMTKLHRGAASEERAATNRPENERREDQNDPKVNSFTFETPSQTIHKQAADKLPKMTDDNMPLCGGLIHRTEAGRKHCVERFAGSGSKMFSSGEPSDAFKDTGEQKRPSVREHKDNPLKDDEYDHFYYFDGVLKQGQRNFYPYYERLRKRSRDNTEKSDFRVRKRRDTQENLLSYIRRLALRNKASRFE